MFYVFAILASFLYGFQFIITKKYQLVNGNKIVSALFYSAISSLIISLICLVINGFKIEFSWFSFVLALCFSLSSVLCTIAGIKTISMGPISIYTLFLMLGSLFVPFAYGYFFLNEPLTPLRIIGIVVLAIAIIFPSLFKKENDKKGNIWFYLLCMILFFTNGICGAIVKAHQVNSNAISSTGFSVLYFFMTFVVASIMFVVFLIKEKPINENNKPLFNGKALIFTSIYAIIHGTADYLQLLCAEQIDATILFPLIAAGVMISSAIFALIFYKEKIGIKQLIPLILSIISNILLVI